MSRKHVLTMLALVIVMLFVFAACGGLTPTVPTADPFATTEPTNAATTTPSGAASDSQTSASINDGSGEPTPQVTYMVEYYLQNVAGTAFDKSSAQSGQKTGDAGAVVSVQTDLFEGFELDTTQANTLSGTLAEGTNLVLKAYFKRSTYTITYKLDDAVIDGAGGSFVYGADISAVTCTPTVANGYQFDGWDTTLQATMPAHNIVVSGTSSLIAPTANITSSATGAVSYGTTVTLTASATHPTLTPTYQWQKYGGTSWVDVQDATESTLTLTAVAQSGSYRVVVTVADTANSKNTATTAADVTIVKATPSVTTAPSASALFAGNTLAESTLTGGVASVAGTFAWENPTTVPTASGNFNVVFTPADVDNYRTATVAVAVTVNANQYILTVTAQDGGSLVENYNGLTNRGASVTVAVTVSERYSFAGWFVNGEGTAISTDLSYTFDMPAQDYTLVAKFTAHVAYTVVHKQQNLDGATFAEVARETLYALPGASVTAVTKNYVGFTAPTADVTGTVLDNGTTELIVEYTRNAYRLHVTIAGISTPIYDADVLYGSDLSALVSAPAQSGHSFAGWTPELPATMPAEALTIVGTYDVVAPTVIITDNGGTTSVTLTAVPTHDLTTLTYQWYTVVAGEATPIAGATDAVYTIADTATTNGTFRVVVTANGLNGATATGSADVIVSAAGTVETFPVTLTPTAGVTYTDASASPVVEGGSFSFKLTIGDAYEGTPVVKVNGVPLEAVSGTYTIADIAEAKVVTVEGITKKTVAITKPSGAGYSFNGNTSVEYGTDYTFTVEVATGYTLTAVKVGGTPIEAVAGVYTITNVTAEPTIIVEVALVVLDVTIPTNVAYTIVGSETVNYGENYTFTLTVNTGYQIGAVKVNGKTVVPDGTTYTVTGVTEDLTIVVEGAQKQSFTVGPMSGTGYTIVPEAGSASPVEYGGSFSFKVVVADGYAGTLVVTAGGAMLTANNGVYTVENITEAKTIAVSGLALKVYNVTLPTVGVMTVGAATTTHGNDYTFTLDIATGYEGTPVVKLGEQVLVADGNTYTISASDITDDITITVEGVTKKTFAVTIPTVEGATITPEAGSTSPVEYGDSFSFKVTVADSHEGTLVVKVNGEAITAVAGVYTIENITEAKEITVEGLAIKTYTVTLPAQQEVVTVTPVGSTTVEHGSDFEFTVTVPAEGTTGTLVVKANGVVVEMNELGTAYIIKNVTAAQEITVEGITWQQITVVVPSGDGYTIVPETELVDGKIDWGKDYKFTITLAPEYSNSTVVVKVGTTTITPVSGVYTIAAIKEGTVINVEGVTKNTYEITRVDTETNASITYMVNEGAANALVNGTPVTATHGDKVVITVTYNQVDYLISSFKVNGVEKKAELVIGEGTASFTIASFTAATEIEVTIAHTPITYTIPAGAYTIKVDGETFDGGDIDLEWGVAHTVQITPNTGNYVVSITMNGNALTEMLDGSVYTVTAENAKTNAVFAVTTKEGTAYLATVRVIGKTDVVYYMANVESNGTITIPVPAGKQINRMFVDGVEVTTANVTTGAYTFGALTAPTEVLVSFASATVTEISSVEQLMSIGVKAEYPLDGNYLLTKNLNLAGIAWTPIGTYDKPFTGIFLGVDDVTISNLNITTSVGTPGVAGLFGAAEGAVIGNFVLTDATLNVTDTVGGTTNTAYAGFVVGAVRYTAVKNVTINVKNNAACTMTVTNPNMAGSGQDYVMVGAIVGGVDTEATIAGCNVAKVTITAATNVYTQDTNGLYGATLSGSVVTATGNTGITA